MSWTLLLFVAITAAIWLRWRYKNRRVIKMAEMFPGPRPLPLLGNALLFICQPEDLATVLKNLIRDHGDAFRFWLGPDLNIVVSNPDDLKILLSNPKTSIKGPQYKYMADYLGEGILSGSGSIWRKHRKIVTPNYGKRAIESYSDIFNKEVDLLLEKLRTIPIEQQFDIFDYIVQTTSYAVCQTLMGLTKEQTMALPYLQEIIDGTQSMYEMVFDRMTKWYLQIDYIYWMSGLHKKQKQFVQMMTNFCNTIVQHSNEKLKTLKEECKSNLINSKEDDQINTNLSVIERFILSQELNCEELIQETFTIFTSSQEASAKIASYIILMLAFHPKCQDKLYEEIITVIGDKDAWVSEDDFKKMPYLELVFKEVLRLFPIGVILQRTINEDIKISSGTLPAGSSLVAPILHMHRDPRFWTNPEQFDPERFNPQNSKFRHPNCYIPFSIGPMDCLGRYFGTKLVKTICVRVLREFEITSLESYQNLKISMAISATSIDGYKILLQPRQRSKRSS